MLMRVICAGLMVLFFSVMPLFAQNQPPSPDEIIQKMQSKLNLTSDQVTAITPIITNYASKFEALRQQAEDGSLDRSDMHEQMKSLREAEKQELSQILSAEQISQWMQMSKGHHHNEGSGQAGTEGGGNSGG